MKKLMTLLVLVFATTIFISSCGDDADDKKPASTTTKTEAPKKEEAPKAAASGDVAKGKELFGSKTCASCHAPDKKVVGPSIKDVVAKYASAGDIVTFLNGNSEAIVDTDPGQVAVMKANIDGLLKSVTDAEKMDIAAYMMSLK